MLSRCHRIEAKLHGLDLDPGKLADLQPDRVTLENSCSRAASSMSCSTPSASDISCILRYPYNPPRCIGKAPIARGDVPADEVQGLGGASSDSADSPAGMAAAMPRRASSICAWSST
jgi:hypothetical protein